MNSEGFRYGQHSVSLNLSIGSLAVCYKPTNEIAGLIAIVVGE